MKLAQAKALAEKESRENPGCTIFLCAAFIYNMEMLRRGDAPRIDDNGYKTCDFYDSSVIARIVDGKWRDVGY